MKNKYIENIENIFNNIKTEYDLVFDSVTKKKDHTCKRANELEEEIETLKKKLTENNTISTPQVKKYLINETNLQQQIILLQNEIDMYKNKIIFYDEKFQEKDIFIKSLKNEILDLKGSIRVFLRIRKTETNNNLRIKSNSIQINYNKKNMNFEFDKIFDICDQKEIFNEFENLIESVFDGYKVCVFAYGQTGSGKTYTMIGDEKNPGLIYNSMELLFKLKEENKNFNISIKGIFKEIYNEEIFNLGDKNINEYELTDLETSINIIKNISNLRITKSTKCNVQSSRSHLVCTINIEMKNENELRIGTLCFVDLAGSERLNQSQVEGLRLKETQNINKSLSTLGDVITALKRKDSHIPYRNSKLTFLLSSYFQGKSRVVMILNINSDVNMLNETMSTFRFGSKISECKLGQAEKTLTKKI